MIPYLHDMIIFFLNDRHFLNCAGNNILNENLITSHFHTLPFYYQKVARHCTLRVTAGIRKVSHLFFTKILYNQDQLINIEYNEELYSSSMRCVSSGYIRSWLSLTSYLVLLLAVSVYVSTPSFRQQLPKASQVNGQHPSPISLPFNMLHEG